MNEALYTVGQALHVAMHRLVKSSGPSQGGPVSTSEASQIARGEAEWLLQSVVGWTPTKMLMSLQDPLPEDVAKRFFEAVDRRSVGEPLQYIIGEAPFYGRWFHVEPGCLIPRPETELLAEEAITYIRSVVPNANVVDIGTGSGAIAVTVALECSMAGVTAVDLSEDALCIAKVNADALGAHITFVHEDGLEWLGQAAGKHSSQGSEPALGQAPGEGFEQAGRPSAAAKIQVLISNPPYIPTGDIESLNTDVRVHEPRLALDGGADGLDFYRKLADLGPDVFADGPAALFLEVGAGQAEDVRRLFEQGQFADEVGWTFELIRDLQGIKRIVKGIRKG